MFHLFEKVNNGEVYVIAEMSANHGGSLDNALEIVRQSAKAGADCLKIQTYTADSITMDCDNDYFRIKGGLWDGYRLYDLYSEAGTPYEWHAAIKEECEKCGMDFLSTPFDKTAVDFLGSLGTEAYKIASFELVDIPLIEYAASKGKPMIMSCGMASVSEIQDAVDACRRMGNDQIVLLKCCSEYPANWEDMHLGNIPDMKKRFGTLVGLSDHSFGSIGAVVGVSLGACVVEKHIKLDGVKSADSEFSMSVQDFASMVSDVRNASRIAQGPIYEPSAKEKASMVFRRSIFASEDIKAGEDFSEKNIRVVRPGNGLSPKYYNELIGTVCAKDIKRGEPICLDDIDPDSPVYGKIGRNIIRKASDVCSANGTGEDLYDAGRTDTVTENVAGPALRKAVPEDVDLLFKWANDPEVRRNSFNSEPISYEDHCKWFNKLMNDPSQVQYILMSGDKPVGQIRFTLKGDEALIGYSVAPGMRGLGYGSSMLDLAEMKIREECPEVRKLIGRVKPENTGSGKCFEKNGYEEEYREFVRKID